MKSTVIKINTLRNCIHTTELKLHGDRTGIDGLASIRRSLRLKKGHIVTPLKFYLDLHFASFNGLKPVIFVDDKPPKGHGMMSVKIRDFAMVGRTVTMGESTLYIRGNAIICLIDKNNGKLVGMNSEQVTDFMSAIVEGGMDTKKK